MAKIISIRRGDFVCHEEYCGCKTAGTVVGNPRDPYTGRFCRADEYYAVVKIKRADGEIDEVEMRYLSKIKRLEDFTEADLAQLRREVVLNSDYYTDYQNSFGIEMHSASMFFDSYLSFISELAEEDGYKWDYAEPGSTYYQEGYHTWSEFLERYDTTYNLREWWGCYETFDWVVYEGEEDLREAA